MNKKSFKVSALSKFSHELKTPLHGILGLTDFLKNNWQEISDSEKQDCLASIDEASNDMLNIVNLMLTTQNKEDITFHFKPLDIVNTLNHSVQRSIQLQPQQRKVNLTYVSPLDNKIVKGDEFWLGQVITNILSNAYNHGKTDIIEIVVSNRLIEQQQYCSLVIKDHGPGLAPEFLNNVFEPFNTAETNKKESTGLGLTICKEVVEAHGGHIKAYNNDPRGLAIEINLPVLN